jgi:SSS family transporter
LGPTAARIGVAWIYFPDAAWDLGTSDTHFASWFSVDFPPVASEMTLAGALLYLLALVAIGLATLRHNRTASDFFLAGKRIGLVPLTFTTMASIMSGFVFVGGPGLFYEVGMGSFWIIISSSFTGALMCWVLAKPLQEMAHKHGCLTIPELLGARFNCRVSSSLATVAILLGVMGYLAVQLQALGVILSSLLSISVTSAILIGVGFLAFYSIAGGMLATIYTDMLQGIIMLWAATLLFVFALDSAGGMSTISLSLLKSQPEVVLPWGTVGPVACLSWFFVFSIGSLGQPHVVNRFMMARDLRVFRYFPLILAIAMIVCGLIWLGVGLSVKSLVYQGLLSPLGHPDQAITTFIDHFAPAWLAILAYVGIVAAIMSTADSFVNVGAAALTRDLPRILGLNLKNEVLWARVGVMALFAAAVLFVFQVKTLVGYLGVFSFGTLAACLVPALALGLNWDGANRVGVMLSLVTGLLSSILLEVLDRVGVYASEIPPAAFSLCASLMVFLISSWAVQRRDTR